MVSFQGEPPSCIITLRKPTTLRWGAAAMNINELKQKFIDKYGESGADIRVFHALAGESDR